jgi:fructokinase
MNSNKSRKIFTIGEVVYDIIFKNDHPVAAKPGGSMLNSAVSLGRRGLPVSFTGTCGRDKVGEMISAFLQENKVDTSFLYHEDSQSIIALAFLDSSNNASYAFYKGNEPPEHPPLPSPGSGDILLFGSFYSISYPTREIASKLRDTASGQGAVVVYDPNFRVSHLNELARVMDYIKDNISRSDIVRGSDQDFEVIFGTKTAASTWELPCFRNCSALVYTRSSRGVELLTHDFTRHYPVPAIEPLSTIGAGDSFNAGMIASIYENDISKADIHGCSEQLWDKIIGKGIEFSTLVCMSYDNYIPFPG